MARSTPPGVVQPGDRRRSALNHPCPFTGAAYAASSSKQTKSRLPVESWIRWSNMHEVNDRGSSREKIEIPEKRCRACLSKRKKKKKTTKRRKKRNMVETMKREYTVELHLSESIRGRAVTGIRIIATHWFYSLTIFRSRRWEFVFARVE